MSSYQRLNLIQLTAMLTSRVGNDATFWGESEKRRALNEALRVWAVMSGQWSRRFQFPTVAGQIFYDVPKQIVSLQRVQVNGTTLFLSSLPELDYGVPNWQQAAVGTPQLWAPVGLDKVAIYPPAPAGQSITFTGLSLTPSLGSGGDFIDLGDEEVNRILDYAHHVLTFKEGGVEFESTMSLLSGFIAAASQKNGRLAASGIFKAWLGLDKAQEQRPVRVPNESIGARAS